MVVHNLHILSVMKKSNKTIVTFANFKLMWIIYMPMNKTKKVVALYLWDTLLFDIVKINIKIFKIGKKNSITDV